METRDISSRWVSIEDIAGVAVMELKALVLPAEATGKIGELILAAVSPLFIQLILLREQFRISSTSMSNSRRRRGSKPTFNWRFS